MSADYRTLFTGLQDVDKRDRLSANELSACEREVIRLMRETTKKQRGRATFIIEFVGTAWHVLEALPPKHVKL